MHDSGDLLQFPKAFTELQSWARKYGLPLQEARDRFAQYCVLAALSQSNELSSLLVFKGGNALDFILSPNRSTRDLDFSVDTRFHHHEISDEMLRRALRQSLQLGSRTTGVAMRLQRVKRNPRGSDKTHVTFDIRVGYAMPDDSRNVARIRRGDPVNAAVPLEISLNEVIGASTDVEIVEGHIIKVATIEDILAEKLRAILQQESRNRYRHQDLLDIAFYLKRNGRSSIDLPSIGQFFKQKAKVRGIDPRKGSFQVLEITQRLRADYSSLKVTTRNEFIPFEEALQILLSFVDVLDIPE